MKIKRLLLVLLCVIIGSASCLLFACGGDNSGRGLDNVKNDLKFDEETGDPIFYDADGKGIQLKVWSIVGNPDATYLEVVNKMFNDYYKTSGLSVKVTPVANADFYTQLSNTLKTDRDNAPDMVIIHSERLPMLASENILMPMDTFYSALGDNNTFKKSNYISTVMNECIYDGKLYGVPLDMHSGVWYCRQDILEKNGLEVPHTLSEFVAVNNALIDKYKSGNLWYRSMEGGVWKKTKDFGPNYNPVVMSSVGGIEMGWIPQTAVFQNGGKLTDSKGNPAWKTQGLEDVMTMFRNWQTGNGDFKGTPYSGAFVAENNDTDTVWSSLYSGRAVFSMEGPWWAEGKLNEYEGVLADKTDDNGNKYTPLTVIDLSKMFALDETKDCAREVYGVGHCFSVCSTVTSKTRCVAAAIYAQFMTENSSEYMQGGHLPACKNVIDSEKFKSMPCYDRYLKLLGEPDNFVMLGGTKNYKAVYESLKNVYADVFSSLKKTVSVKDLISARYNEAMQIIQADSDL